MIENLPLALSLLFIAVALFTLSLFHKAGASRWIVRIIILWMLVQGILAQKGFFLDSMSFPPRFAFLPVIPMLAILAVFLSAKGRKAIDKLDMFYLTGLHVVRIPVEICLYLLFVYQHVPELMTFEGRNPDILSGLTAPFIAWYGFKQKSLNKTALLLWNTICLALLINIVVNAALSVPSPLQQQAFDQPIRAILYFPFTWLPGMIVPLVLFSHLASIRKLLKKNIDE